MNEKLPLVGWIRRFNCVQNNYNEAGIQVKLKRVFYVRDPTRSSCAGRILTIRRPCFVQNSNTWVDSWHPLPIMIIYVYKIVRVQSLAKSLLNLKKVSTMLSLAITDTTFFRDSEFHIVCVTNFSRINYSDQVYNVVV